MFHERRGLKEQSCERFRMKYTTPAAQVMLRTFMAAWAMAVTLWRRVPCWVLRQCTAVVRWAVSTAGRMMPLRLLWWMCTQTTQRTLALVKGVRDAGSALCSVPATLREALRTLQMGRRTLATTKRVRCTVEECGTSIRG